MAALDFRLPGPDSPTSLPSSLPESPTRNHPGLRATMSGGVVGEAKAEAEKCRKRLEKLWANGEMRTLCEDLFTSDACLMAPESNIVYGSAGASKILQRLVSERGYRVVHLAEAETSPASNGHLLTERGAYKFQDDDRQILETGKYVILWKKDGSELKIHNFIWNRNA